MASSIKLKELQANQPVVSMTAEEVTKVMRDPVHTTVDATAGNHADDTAALATIADPVQGDTAVVTRTIVPASEGVAAKVSYTAYVFNGTAWTAMDGNYDASNVYMDEDLMYTVSFGTLAKPTASDTFECKGLSIKEVFSALMAEEIKPTTSTITKPKVAISATSNASGEVGTTYNAPTGTITVKGMGSYPYAPTNPGASFEIGHLEIESSTGTVKTTANSEVITAKDKTVKVTASEGGTYSDTAKTYTFKITKCDYTIEDSDPNPKSNTGKEYPALKLTSADALKDGTTETALNKTASTTFTGYRSFFYGILDNTDALTSKMIRDLSNGGNYNTSKTVYINASTSNHKRFIVAIPSGSIAGDRTGLKTATSTVGMTVDVTGAYVHTAKALKVEGANGASAVDYDVWIWQPDTIGSGVKHTIVLA